MTTTGPPPRRDRLPPCGAKTRSEAAGGRPCQRPAGWGTAHPGDGPCKLHGGSTPSHVHAARARAADAAVATYGARRDVDPITALLDLIATSAGAVAWLAERVAEVDAAGLVVGVAEQRIDADGAKTVIIRSQPSVWLSIYDRERRFLVSVCAEVLRHGVDERIVRLAEAQGDLLCRVLAAVFADPELGLTAGQRAVVDVVVPRHLRAVADNASGPT